MIVSSLLSAKQFSQYVTLVLVYVPLNLQNFEVLSSYVSTIKNTYLLFEPFHCPVTVNTSPAR